MRSWQRTQRSALGCASSRSRPISRPQIAAAAVTAVVDPVHRRLHGRHFEVQLVQRHAGKVGELSGEGLVLEIVHFR